MKYVTGIERRAMERGMEQGVQQGIAQGIDQGQVRLLQTLLAQAFGKLPDDVTERLSTASRDEITRWAGRVLHADSLDEVFGSD